MTSAMTSRRRASASDGNLAGELSDGRGRRVLVITYNWPPDTSIGGVRPVKLVAQLKAQGWEPIILTVHERYYEQCDAKLMDSASDQIVIRTSCLPNLPRLYVAIRSAFKKVLFRSNMPSPTPAKEAAPEKPVAGSAGGGRIKRNVLSILYTPDEHIGWLPVGVWHAMKAVRKYGVTRMVSTGPPFTAHIVALVTSMLSKISWVADFRDPWAMSETRPAEYTSGVSNWINAGIEKVVVHRADRVVCVTSFMTQWYRARYSSLPGNHWETITNGFNLDEFEAVAETSLSDKFTISYLGSIEYERTPELVFQAVRDLFREGLMDRRCVEVRLVGKCHEVRGRPMEELIAEYALDDLVVLVRAVPRREALKEMRQAHVLLLLAPNQKLQIPGKAFEYIGANRRVLAVTEKDSATADVIRSVGGAVVSQGDLEEMKRVLTFWYGEFQDNRNRPSSMFQAATASADFEWTRLGMRYAQVLGSL